MIHTNSTVADKSLTKLQLHVHDKRYTDLFDTMKSQSKRKRKKKETLENVSHNHDFVVIGCLYCTSVLT